MPAAWVPGSSFTVSQTLTTQRETTLGPGKSFRRRCSAKRPGGRDVRPASAGEVLGASMRRPPLRFDEALPGREDRSLTEAVQQYHELGLAADLVLERELQRKQRRSSAGLHRSIHSSGCSRRASQWPAVGPDEEDARAEALSLDYAPPPNWAQGMLAPTNEFSRSADNIALAPGRLSRRICLRPSETPKAKKAAGRWMTVRKAVRPLASARVMERVSVKKGEGLAQPSTTHGHATRGTAVARKSLVQRWAYDAESKLAALEADRSAATVPKLAEIVNELEGALRARVLAPGPLLRARRAHSRAKGWLDDIKPPVRARRLCLPNATAAPTSAY